MRVRVVATLAFVEDCGPKMKMEEGLVAAKHLAQQ